MTVTNVAPNAVAIHIDTVPYIVYVAGLVLVGFLVYRFRRKSN
jgi:hypothetical protein